jgi:hypothetical protein
VKALRRLPALALLLAAPSARAGPFDIFGYGPAGIARGGAMTSQVEDYTATFYNPGALTLNPDISIGIGYATESPRLRIDFDHPGQSSCDDTLRPTIPAHCGDTFAGYWLGVLFPLGGKVKNRVAIGVSAYLPTTDLIRTQSVDQGEPQFYLYQSLPDRITVLAALAVKIIQREDFQLSAGGGVQALADFDGGVNFEVDILAKTFPQRNLRNDLRTRSAPIAGVVAKIHDKWNIGLSYRASLSLPYRLPTKILLTDIGLLTLDIRGEGHWTPHTLVLGVGYRPIPALSLAADLTWEQWSAAPNPQVHVGVSLQGKLLESLGLSGALDMVTNDPPIALSDLLYPRIGGEYLVTPEFAVRAGYVYRPTMVPNQIYASNYLDSTSHILSAGMGYSFKDPLEIFASPVHIDASVQSTFLTDRRVEKSDPKDPVGSYTFGGRVYHFSVALRYDF